MKAKCFFLILWTIFLLAIIPSLIIPLFINSINPISIDNITYCTNDDPLIYANLLFSYVFSEVFILSYALSVYFFFWKYYEIKFLVFSFVPIIVYVFGFGVDIYILQNIALNNIPSHEILTATGYMFKIISFLACLFSLVLLSHPDSWKDNIDY